MNIKITLNNAISLLFILIFFIVLIFPKLALASFFYLSPSNVQSTTESDVQLKLGLNTSGEQVNALTAAISYPADKLDLRSVDYNTTSFPIGADEQKSSGSLKFSRGSFFGVNGDVTVATLHFTTKAGGSGSISFTKDCAVPRASDSSDSFKLNQSAGATILTGGAASSPSPTPTVSISSSSSTLIPTPNFSLNSDQLKSCLDKSEALKSSFNLMLDLIVAYKGRLDKVDQLVQSYLNSQSLAKKQTTFNLVSLENTIQIKKDSLSSKITVLRGDINNFSCDGNPRSKLTDYRNRIADLKGLIKEYQLVDKNLIQTAKTISQK